MHDWDSVPRVAREVPALERRRLLLGFMPEQSAVRKLQSAGTVGSPVDPLASADPDSTTEPPGEPEYVDLWHRAREHIGSRPTYESSAVDLRDLPPDDDVQAHVESFVDDPLTQASLADRPADSWQIKLVPIEHLVAFQPSVTRTAYAADVPTDSGDLVDLLDYALPVDAVPLVEDQRIRDDYFRGWQFVSRSPNVHVSGPYQSRPETDDPVVATVSFELKADPNFVYVAQFEDRYILKNGYHRTYQLHRAGVSHVPAVVLDAETYDDTGGTSSGFFDRERVMGEEPPMMPDFESQSAVDVYRRAKNRVVRVIAETTDILR